MTREGGETERERDREREGGLWASLVAELTNFSDRWILGEGCFSRSWLPGGCLVGYVFSNLT